MTPDSPTLTLIDRLREHAGFANSGTTAMLMREAADELTQARAELARRAEPVAWRCRIDETHAWVLRDADDVGPICIKCEPLYAAPPVSAGDGREAFEAWATSRGLYESDKWMFREGWQGALAWRDGGK